MNEAVKDAELVIEVVPEIMDLKKKVYAELDKAAAPEVVFASNTSTLPITEIANTTSRPEKFIGIHFFQSTTINETSRNNSWREKHHKK